MQIRIATDADQKNWDEYALNHGAGTIFHLCQWQQAIEKAFAHPNLSLLAMKQGEIVGVLPLFELKSRLFGHSLSSVPFAELGGPLSDSAQIAAELLTYATDQGRQLSCEYIELKNQEALPGLPTKALYVNFSREIYPDVEENLLAIPRKSRAAVRKGIKEGLVATFGNDQFDDFYEIMAHSYHQLGTPIFAKKFFRAFLDVFNDDCSVMVVRTKEGQPVAGVLSFYYKDRVLPYYAGSLFEYRKLCTNDFMYWTLMKNGCEKGYKLFDFGRSKVETGSYSFKKHWGFEPSPLAYQYQLITADEMPNLSPANPKYKRKIEMWRKMPFALTKILGPPLAKYLG
ncbi:MAG: FemAB family PEP-CTERM system-associated protein [Desulfuromonadales bacterium]|nr:FemAB family PEP-CTERM system-associated protein [Desulfuromonadales bacterium]